MRLPELSPVELRISHSFMTNINKLGAIDAWWIPERDGVALRAVGERQRGVKRMPASAVFVGRYRHPYLVQDFRADVAATRMEYVLSQGGE